MEAGLRVLRGVDLDDAAHLAAVFGGDAGGVDAERLDVVGFDLGAEAGGAIVGEGDAVDDELGLIFRAAGMEDGVAFVEPAGLGVDEVLQGAAGDGAEAVVDGAGAEDFHGAGLIDGEKGVRGVDRDGFSARSDFELEGNMRRRRGADLNGLRNGREASCWMESW